jgi:hypothetical protein
MSNSDINSSYEDSPLLDFSFYTDGQATYIIKLGNRLIGEMQKWDSTLYQFNEVYYQYWLWVLGAYEIVRHMSESRYSDSFSPQLKTAIEDLKPYLTEIRIPFAKQELAKKKNSSAITELSVVGTDKDMTFIIKGIEYSAIESINKFRSFVEAINQSDILKRS